MTLLTNKLTGTQLFAEVSKPTMNNIQIVANKCGYNFDTEKESFISECLNSGISILYLEQEWQDEFLTFIQPYVKKDGTQVEGHYKNPNKTHVLPNGEPSGFTLEEEISTPVESKLYSVPKKIYIKGKEVYNQKENTITWIHGKWMWEISKTHCKDEEGNIFKTTSLY